MSDMLQELLIKFAQHKVEYFTQRQNRGAVATGSIWDLFKLRFTNTEDAPAKRPKLNRCQY
jgi:hypothetical protein